MPAVPNPLSALGPVSLTAKAAKDFRDRDEVGHLFRLVGSDVQKSDLLPFGRAKEVVARLEGLLVQPEIAEALTRWLDQGDASVREPLQARFAQLLVFADLDSQALAKLVVDSIEANLPRAKKSDREAMILEGQRTRSDLSAIQGQIADVASTMGRSAPVTARSLQMAHAIVELAPSQARIVERLVSADPDGAVPVQEALAAGGAVRVVEAIEGSRPWLDQASAAVWEAVGRLAEAIGRMGPAQHAYERAADHPGVGDRVRQLVRASNAAEAQDDSAREKELLDAARSEDGQNPAVLLCDARDLSDPDQTLELLDRIAPVDDDQAASLEVVRVEALITKCAFDEAREAIKRAQTLQADSRGPEEIEACVVLTEAQMGLPDDRAVTPERLISAAETFVRLANEMRDQERWYGVAILTGRAIVGFVLAGHSGEASRLLTEAIADERLLGSIEARRLFASGALLLQRFNDVLMLVPESDEERDRLDRLAAQVLSGDPARSAETIDELRELMAVGGEGSPRAAYFLLCASSNNAAIEWDAEAERIVGEQQPSTSTMLKAFRLDTEGNLDGAEAHLRPHTDNPDALRYLVHLAGRQEDHGKAIRFAETLVQRTGAAADRLLLAAALARDGQQGVAIDRLLALARDSHASYDERATAFARAARLTQEADRFPDLEILAREWAQFDSSDDPRWMTVLALAMRFRHSEALTAWRELGEPEANSVNRARLLGEVFGMAADPVSGLEMLTTLSDRFDRPEELEVALIFAAIRLEAATPELPPDLEARIRESFATFPERFPDSTSLRAVSMDPANPAASLVAAFGQQLEHRAETTEQLAAGIRAGTTAVPLLAAAAGRSIGETVFLLPALPISFPDDQSDRLDRADAAHAYKEGAAVWDASAIFLVAGLGETLERTIRSVLPASGVGRATQQDAARDLATSPTADRGEISMSEGVLVFGSWSQSDREANHRRATEMQRLATDLPTLSLSAATNEDQLLEIATNNDAPTSIRSWAGTFALARREGLAVFSDDRVVRRSARELGLKTFGTMAFLEVLVDYDVLQASERDAARHRVLSRGAWGVQHSAAELIRLGREADWEPTRGLRAALGDTGAWVVLRARWTDRVLTFLDTVAQEAPEKMDKWVHRAVDAVSHDVGGDYLGHAKLFLFAAINPLADPLLMTDQGLRSLIASLRGMRYFQIFRPPRDLLIVAVEELLVITEDPSLQAVLFRRVSDRLRSEDKELLRKHFVR